MSATEQQDRAARLVVVGQGYVGLPIAVRAVEVGYDVVGFDVDTTKVARLNAADSYVEDVPSADLQACLDTGRYTAQSSADAVAGFDFAIITVPTPLREGLPDLSFIELSAEALAPHVRPGTTVVLESTTYPGTTEELLIPILEAGSGLRAGVDFFVGYSPERIDPGNPTFGFVNTPKVVAGIDEASLAVVAELYGSLVDSVVKVSDCKVAELTKLLENTFRHVNIALVNELAVFAHQLGIDVWEAIDASSTKPFGYMRFTPGPGVGGHCLPVDPSYLSWQVKRTLGTPFRFVELANDVNDHMPDYVVRRTIDLLNRNKLAVNGARILVVGLAYKKNTADIREAPSARILELLFDLGAEIRYVDPHVEARTVDPRATAAVLDEGEASRADLVIVVTDHDDLDYAALQSAPVVLDTRRRIPPAANVVYL